jgi:hypothetical protein
MTTPLNGSRILVPIRTAVSAYRDESIGTGNGSMTAFSYTMAYMPLFLNSVPVTAGSSMTASDDGLGNPAGTSASSGSIKYDRRMITT